jgi:hypothetical protein
MGNRSGRNPGTEGGDVGFLLSIRRFNIQAPRHKTDLLFRRMFPSTLSESLLITIYRLWIKQAERRKKYRRKNFLTKLLRNKKSGCRPGSLEEYIETPKIKKSACFHFDHGRIGTRKSPRSDRKVAAGRIGTLAVFLNRRKTSIAQRDSTTASFQNSGGYLLLTLLQLFAVERADAFCLKSEFG